MEKIVACKCEERKTHSYLRLFFFWGITIDIIFLPYLSFMAVSASVLLVAIWLLLNAKSTLKENEQIIFFFMVSLMIVGTLINLVFTGEVRFETTFLTSVKRLFQYFICFVSYFFYKSFFTDYEVDLKKIIYFAILYIAFFALLFKLFPLQYANIKLILNPADNHTRRFLDNAVQYRFNYLWTDPNNISYLTAGLCAWLLMRNDISFLKKIIVLIASIFIAFCTVSNGGIIMLLLMLVVVVFIAIKNVLHSGINIWTLLAGMLIVILGIVLFQITDIKSMITTNYISLFTDRMNRYTNGAYSLGGRLEDFSRAIPLLNPIMLLIGTGNEGVVYEIGHIYWIGMYGVPAYCMFMWFMFRKLKHQTYSQCVWMIPFFVGFTVNIAIGEYKWLAIYLMLLAYNRYNCGANSVCKNN